MTVNITVPEVSLVVLIGVSGSGKSTFARTHFLPTEIISSDFCRGLVSDDENSQDATKDAFEVVHFIAGKRLANMKLTVIDATSVQPDARKPLMKLAREHHALLTAIVLDVPERICIERNQKRADRNFGAQVIKRQRQELKRSLRLLEREGFRQVYILKSEEEIAAVQITRQPLHNNLKHEHGPFDIIGDVHGCFDELVTLLENMGYAVNSTQVTPPNGRKAIFLGDLVDRGPKIPDVLRLVMGMVEAGTAICVPGNHDIKLMRKLRGRDVQIKHGLAESLAQLENETPEFKKQVADFVEGLISHYVLDGGRLVVAHAGMKENYAGRASGTVREFALYGETTGETDEFGLPVRHNWAAEYRGNATVIYGHTPVPQAEWLNRTINIDTGCVFGGALTALRYPEKEVVSVPARHTYSEPVRPFLTESAPALTSQQQYDDVLDIEDVIGKHLINTRLMKHITIREENAIAALEVMSRFAVNPKWLIYLPPTMSPTETTQLPDLLEHPLEAFAYYRDNGVPQVICEEKHMGSRAVVIVCRDEDAARRRFGVIGEGFGVCYTRTGRRFFDDRLLETEFLSRVRDAIGEAGWWDELNTDWVALDCELMPWSAKAQELLQRQYAAVGSAAGNAMRETIAALEMTSARLPDAAQLLGLFQPRAAMVNRYIEAYRRYCWDVTSIDDLKLAPFHLLASERATHADKLHLWHMEMIGKLHEVGETVLYPTAYITVDVTNPDSQAEGVRWWEEMTQKGGEGMVVKPLDFIAKGRYSILQPAMKVRGREYLRIIYGPEYTAPEQIARLRSRALKGKRSLAAREFALSIESLERFVQKEPLRRVHECVFGVLAFESEPVDPRL